MKTPPVVAVVGPTAAGKSGFAVEAARRFGGEILSCDSMQVYRGLDIGTDKIPPERRGDVPHHLIDVRDPGEEFSAGTFRRMAIEVLEDLERRRKVAFLVGGTGLYYRTLVSGMVEAPPRDPPLRAYLRERMASRGVKPMHRLLLRLDPDSARTIRERDSLRILRALEVRILTRKPLGRMIRRSPFGTDALPDVLLIGLTAPRNLLYDRIEERVDAMLADGWLDEVARLRERGWIRGATGHAIGYGELSSYLDGDLTLEEAAARIKRRSRNLAKRQWTWFRKEPGIHWYDISEEDWKKNAIRFIDRWLQETARIQRD